VLVVGVVAAGLWFWSFNVEQQQVVPVAGGTLHEGVVGSPRFVNPVLAITRADQDLVQLLFRGLYTIDDAGELTLDLAESVTRSDDGLVYNVRLQPNQQWHDGVAITAEDVAFTIGLVQNPELKSPVRGNWNDVTVEVINELELNIVLEEAYVPFEENLSLGILPRHLWERLSTDEIPFSPFNTEPVGSGAFAISETVRGESGLIERYELTPTTVAEPTPRLAAVHVHFFATEAAVAEALAAGTITHTAALETAQVATLTDDYTVHTRPSPRVFALYPNQNRNPVLRDQAARAALSQAIDREELIAAILAGYGRPAYGPIPVGFGPQPTTTSTTSLAAATETLLAGGWIETEEGGWIKSIDDSEVSLTVTITSANGELFAETADAIAAVWTELGVDVSVALYEQADLVQAVIRPREYELLLFGADVGRAADLFPFWHSSQREDPGLNVALYTSITADDVLEDYRTNPDPAARDQLAATFTNELLADSAAIFLYSPLVTYVTRSDIPISLPEKLSRPSERFATMSDWYIEAESLWPLFINQ
jgi:peptide/nickel transport system substrate-binding protein